MKLCGFEKARAWLTFGVALTAQAAIGLGLNVDFDDTGGPPQTGGGLPSDAFGAASGQAGRWNWVPATAGGTYSLVDLLGNPTDVVYHGDGMSGTGGGYNDPYNLGDYRYLMNDFNQFSGLRWFELTGLPNGRYQVWTYATTPWPWFNPVEVSVLGADPGQNPQTVTGPITPNEFGSLITHSVHDVNVTNGAIRVELFPGPGANVGIVNGFQVVPVPEPGGLITMGGALAALLVSKGRFRPRTAKEENKK